jgi:hypothetical protein
VAERPLPEAHRAVVDRLAAELRPVRRLRPPLVRLAAWLPLQLVALAWVVGFHLRPDAAAELGRPLFLLELAGLTLAGAVAAALALRSAVPGEEPGTGEVAGAVALALAASLLVLFEPGGGVEPLRAFVAHGVGCAILTTLLALVPWIALLAALARGAPLDGRRAGTWAGVAAFLLACALMRFACGLDERMHLLVWHAAPVVPAALLSAWVGWTWLGRFRTR